MRKLVLFTLLFCGTVVHASGATIAECTFVRGLHLEEEGDGLKSDGWETIGSKLIIERAGSGNFDLLVAEPNEPLTSLKSEGAAIKLQFSAPGFMTFLITDKDGLVQSLVLKQSQNNTSKLLSVGQNRDGHEVSAAVIYGKCGKTTFFSN